MTHIQTYLRGGGTLEVLERDLGIKATRHKKYPNLVLLKYNQLYSDFSNPLVGECRGIILDQDDDWHCVSRAFDKFFNYGDPMAAEIDWGTARVQEKMDGSLIVAYPYDGHWQIASSGTPDGSGDVMGYAGMMPNGVKSFADLFWWTLEHQHRNGFGKPTDNSNVLIFELCSPYNRIVVQHQVAYLTLLSVRRDGESPEMAVPELFVSELAVPKVREFSMSSIGDILESFDELDPLHQEGYVVVDAQFNRLKVKHPQYIALHHLKGTATPKGFLEVIRKNEDAELLSVFPELMSQLEANRVAFEALAAEIEQDYARIKHHETQKDFALEAVQTRCPAALFQMRAGRAPDARAYLAECSIDQLTRLLNIQPDEGRSSNE